MEADKVDAALKPLEKADEGVCMSFVVVESGEHGVFETYAALAAEVILSDKVEDLVEGPCFLDRHHLPALLPERVVEADGEVFEGDFIFGAVCNSTSLGGLVKLDESKVEMDDGKFELLLLRMPKTVMDLNSLIAGMTKMDYDQPGVIFRHVGRVTLTTEDDIPWSLDGEYAASCPVVEIQNLHHAISLMM